MAKPTRFAKSAAAIMLTVYSALMSPIATGLAAGAPSDGGRSYRVPMTLRLRFCDFSVRGPTNVGPTGSGEGEATIRSNGNTVTAELTFIMTQRPGMHYEVGLIQVPRPVAESCGPGSPGTAYTGMDIGADGMAHVTLQDTIQQGTTGVWLKIDRPHANTQFPAEYYSSLYLAKV